LSPEDAQDLVQECLMHWLGVRSRVVTEGDERPVAYLRSTVDHRIADLLRREHAAKRGAGVPTLSLDEPMSALDGTDAADTPPLGDLIADDLNAGSLDRQSATDLRMDLARSLGVLTERQRQICRLLGEEGLTAAEAAREMGLARSTLYLELNEIRKRLDSAGLRAYLGE
jgi:RNA polymerase sigma-70 factor (ECF subfamily)